MAFHTTNILIEGFMENRTSSVLRFSVLIMLVVVILGSSESFARMGDDKPPKQSKDDITIVYNVNSKEFTCWFEGKPVSRSQTVEVCGANTHPFSENDLYFHRGQTIHLQLVGAHIMDLFSVELKADELVEPGVPIFGGLSQLPSVKLIEPAETFVTRPPAKFSKGSPFSDILLYNLDKFKDNKELGSFLDAALIGPSNNDKLLRFLSDDPDARIKFLDNQLAQGGRFVKEATALQLDLANIKTVSFNDLERYCKSPPEDKSTRDDLKKFTDALRMLNRILDRQRTLKEEITTVGLSNEGKALIEQVKTLTDPIILRALEIEDIHPFADAFDHSFPLQFRTALIKSIVLKDKKYLLNKVEADANGLSPEPPLLEQINRKISEGTAEGTKQLISNLLILASRWGEVKIAQDRLIELHKNKQELNDYVARVGKDALTMFEYQKVLDAISALTIQTADQANYIAQQMPLPEPYNHVVLGRWFGNKDITLTLKQGTRFQLYEIGGVGSTSRLVTTGSEIAKPTDTRTALQALAVVRQTKFSIHNLYNFQMAAGFIVSNLKDNDFKVVEKTVMEAGVTRAEKFFVQTRDRDSHFLATIELMIYPKARDMFPWKARYEGEKPPSQLKNIGALIGFSLADPTQDFFFGVAWLPRSGIGIKGGIHLGFEDELPKGVMVNVPLTETVTQANEKLKHGFFIGLSLSSQIFKDVFGIILK